MLVPVQFAIAPRNATAKINVETRLTTYPNKSAIFEGPNNSSRKEAITDAWLATKREALSMCFVAVVRWTENISGNVCDR